MTNPLPVPAVTTSGSSQPVATNQAISYLGVAKGVSLAATGDAAIIPILSNPGTYSVYQVIVTNASADVHTGAVGVFTGAGATGTAIVSNAALTGVTGSTIVSQRTVASTAVQTGGVLYFNVGTAVAGTVDVFIVGYNLTIP